MMGFESGRALPIPFPVAPPLPDRADEMTWRMTLQAEFSWFMRNVGNPEIKHFQTHTTRVPVEKGLDLIQVWRHFPSMTKALAASKTHDNRFCCNVSPRTTLADSMNRRRLLPRIVGLLSFILVLPALASDWPMWRFDANRSAASTHALPDELHLQWTREYSPRVQVWDDPLNHDLMQYDKVFEPVVLGERMFVSFNDTDKVVALDIRTGAELWAFYTGGPVRFPPVAWNDKVYFVSDDGFLYCVGAADGALQWKFLGGPSERKALGNQRLISIWPARGGPVLRDGHIYFAASIWPFMGTFIYALNAESGTVAWVNDGTGAQFIRQPHSAPAFAGVAPQGTLVATESMLLIPGGRSVPAAFDRATGDFLFFHLNDGGKGNGGSFVVANESEFFVHTRLRGVRAYNLKTGQASKFTTTEPVLDGNMLYAASTNSRGQTIQAIGPDKKVRWQIEADATGDLIKAGRRLYAAGADKLTAIELPVEGEEPRVVWSRPVEGEVLRLLAANGKLFAVTLDGRILAFGSEKTESRRIPLQHRPRQPDGAPVAQAKSILDQTGVTEGYALWFGIEDGQLLEAVALNSELHIVAVDPDAAKVDRLRRAFDAAGLYGTRVALHTGDPVSFKAPPYIASLIVVGESFVSQLRDRRMLEAVYQSLRPYGGALWLPVSGAAQAEWASAISRAQFEQARVRSGASHLLVTREGALPDSADWTHRYGDIGNTVKSDDARVKAPLGLLWFGGNSNMDVLPRHGHGPPEQVIGGRLFIQGMNSISARDVYTGRVLWKTEFEDLGTFGIYYDASYTNTPLSTAYNQKHIPGANGRGANFIATEHEIYVVVGSSCEILDAKTGKVRGKITLPPKPGETEPPEWGFIAVYDDLLLGGHGFAHYTQKFGSISKTNTSNTIEDFSASAGLVAFNRHSGELVWRVPARHSFIHNGIVAGNGRIFCLDKLPQSAEDRLKRRGAPAPSDYRIAAFDVRTGDFLWEAQQNIFGTWLGYSKQHDVLLLAGARATDRLRDEVGEGMTAFRGTSGDILWQDLKRRYTGPCILHNDVIFTSANSYQASSGAFNLLDGTPHMIRNPLTGKLEPWRISRAYGCNSFIASENLLTFRSGAAGFYDLLSNSGTANLGGFRSGCTANLVVANGVLNAPDYTRTCSCAYQNQTSLGLVHMPDMEMWSYSLFGLDGEDGDRIERVGVNFGAPGDRRSEEGTMWLEFPEVGGDSPSLQVTVTGERASYFRRHASQVSGPGLPWVAASGVIDCESVRITPEIIRPPKPSSKPAAKPSAEAAAEEPEAPKEKRVHPPAPYTVRLYFVEPDDLSPGQRVFGVSLQGRPVLEKFDPVRAAAGRYRPVMKEFNGIIISDALEIAFRPASGSQAGPVLSGVELIAELGAGN
jgi:outer membrane protein assembly factor BamB